jgi:hypothetical protein
VAVKWPAAAVAGEDAEKHNGEGTDNPEEIGKASVVTCAGHLIERRWAYGQAWALVALEPVAVDSGPVAGSGAAEQGLGDWEMSFAATVARGWVWGRIRDQDVGRIDAVKSEAGPRVVVEFDARHARWFERSVDGWEGRTSQG